MHVLRMQIGRLWTRREVQRWRYRVGTGQRLGQTGSITVVQRFGLALLPHPSFHCLGLDRVCAEDGSTGA